MAAYRYHHASEPGRIMKQKWRAVSVIGAAALILLAAGCHKKHVRAASMGAPPVSAIPVGPVPGSPHNSWPMPANPYQGNAAALMQGRQLFVQFNCFGCHGGHGGGGMGPSLRRSYFRYGHSSAHIYSSISEGRGMGMPAWGTKVPQNDIWKLVLYIKSLRTPQEPDPPLMPKQTLIPQAK